MDPQGKVALITGGARIGVAVCEWLATRGCHIALSYRTSKQSAEKTVAVARRLGVEAVAIRADLKRARDITRLIAQVNRRLGRLDILVNMASIYERTPWSSLGLAAWQENLDANLRSAYLASLAAAPLMKRRGAGRIINIADWLPASHRPRYTGFLPYYVSKAGVIGLTESLALELAPEVLVNAIAPGPILKPAGLSAREDQDVRRATPLGRWGGAEEIARTVLFLVETEFVTGECLRVDGGRHLR